MCRSGNGFLWAPLLKSVRAGALAVLLLNAAGAQEQLEGSEPLTVPGSLSAEMVAGISRFLDGQTERAAAERGKRWRRDLSSPSAYEASLEGNRLRLRAMIGATDPRLPVNDLILVCSTKETAVLKQTPTLTIRAVRWPVFEGVFGEGLWLRPKGRVAARIVVLPDADQTPEMLTGVTAELAPERQFARRLAEHGCEVLVPVLVSRSDLFSGSTQLNRFTNQPHREWIYRQAYEMGRHVVGYEVQKVLAAIDFFQGQPEDSDGTAPRIGVAGHCEGGLIALYAGALDTRIDACLISGYFDSRQGLWREPIYRNVFGLLREFGDAELASLVAPRTLVVEHSETAHVHGPPPPRQGRSGAAPGAITTPEYDSVRRELDRAKEFLQAATVAMTDRWNLVAAEQGSPVPVFSDGALRLFCAALDVPDANSTMDQRASEARATITPVVLQQRQERQVRELEEYTQKLQRASETVRDAFFWTKSRQGDISEWRETTATFRTLFRKETMGAFGIPALPLNARTRKILDGEEWKAFEVMLDVYPDVFAWGYLLLPRDLKPGERRPVVVCQHGLEGLPADTINPDPNSEAFRYYKAFAARLAERGFIVFSPHNPYRGQDKFRELQRKANPLGTSLFSIIIAQHAAILKWLGEQPFADPQRIGFYGLSYGGKTAMRVPAVLDGYCLSICSADFNEWVRKNVSVDAGLSYMYTGEYEMPEWNLGHTFNYAEMAALIAPRPFMVERGHDDGVGIDEWVAYEYAKVRRLYARLGIPDRTAIEYFNGPHTIHGVGTFEFLETHLNWRRR